MDHTFLLSSPLRGIGDTLAKWYEAEAINRNAKETLPLMVHAALKQAVYVRDILLSLREEACLIGDYTKEQIVDAIQIIETYQHLVANSLSTSQC